LTAVATSNEARFAFGRNWKKFVGGLEESQIAQATSSMQEWFDVEDLKGKSFLDIGCGSGLFSLVAHRLGASVHSFDFDADSVAATMAVQRTFAPTADNWTVEQGSVLDPAYLQTLGRFDYVYCWGVLHHTGDLWHALGAVPSLMQPGGKLMLSLYNDGGRSSRMWIRIKRAYVRHPRLRPFLIPPVFVRFWGPNVLRDGVRRHDPLWTWRNYGLREGARGMSAWTDFLDWIGGYPFQPSTPGDVFTLLHDQGLTLLRMHTITTGLGCNEYLFQAP